MSDKVNTVCLTFDFDALSVWLSSYHPATPAMQSRGEYGARIAVPVSWNCWPPTTCRQPFSSPGTPPSRSPARSKRS